MAGPIAIGIITVIHSRSERDFAAKIFCTILPLTHAPAKHALGLDPRVESGSPKRTCVNTGICGVSRSYGITE